MKYSLLFALLFACFIGHAQTGKGGERGVISGKVVNATSKEPVYYATVAVFTAETNKLINGATADEKGVFTINGLPFGYYKVEVKFLGYTPTILHDININAKNSSVQLGNVALSEAITKLKDVSISAQKSAVEYKNDKVVYNVEHDLTSQGGVATDVLKKIPQVAVDVDGNVELQGNTNIRFLINGKPSSIFGNNLADALRSIPASQIKSIEVITSPGAKYDAEGTGGIINIILKDNQLQGVNGSVSLSAGTRLENGSLNLNVRKGNFGVNAFFSGNAQLTSRTLNASDRLSTDPATQNTTRLFQDGNTDFRRQSYQTGIGFDWSISKKDNITGTLGGVYFGNYNNGFANQQLLVQDANSNTLANSYSVRNADTKFDFNSMDWSLNYRKTFEKENRELNISTSSSYGKNTSYYLQSQNYTTVSAPYAGATSSNPGTDREMNIQADYTHPIGKDAVLETGAKAMTEYITSTANLYALYPVSGDYVLDPSQSYSLKFNRNVYAYYLSASFNVLHYLEIKIGGRYERTENSGQFSNVNNVAIPPYNTWVPSLTIVHNFEDNQALKLSYSHRIERPEYRELNPFVNSSDPHNITMGNPSLLPEIADKVELGYRKVFRKGISINLAAFYQKNTQDIKQYVAYYPSYTLGDSTYTNVSVTNYTNVNSEQKGGISSYVSIPASAKLTLRSNFSIYERYVQSDLISGSSIHGIEYRVSLNGTYQLPKNMTFEFFGNFNSPRTGLQGKYPSFTSYNFAFRKQFFHEKASLALTATNPFNEYVNQKTELAGTTFTLVTIRQIPYRSFGINFTYKFGKLEFKKKKEEENNPGNPFE